MKGSINMALVSLIFKAVLSRLLFLAHGFYAVYHYADKQNNVYYWFLLTPLILLVIESFITVFYRKGNEYRYFWPSGFFYITCFITIIWCIELELFEKREHHEATRKREANYTFMTSVQQEKLMAELFMDAVDQNRHFTLKKVCELGLVIGIIIGRWLMPRGEMTREQLSALLLLYVGNAADILELFAVFEEPGIVNEKGVLIAVVLIFSWSMYQFSLVATATDTKTEIIQNTKQSRQNDKTAAYTQRELETNGGKDLYIKSIRTRLNTASSLRDGRGRGRKQTLTPEKIPVNEGATQQKERIIKYREIHGETFQILVTLLMQDGPFLVLRSFLLVKFNISSEMHIFFTCKNAIVSILLIYRLLVLSCSGNDDEVTDWQKEETAAKLHNIQVALEDMKLHELSLQMTNIRVK